MRTLYALCSSNSYGENSFINIIELTQIVSVELNIYIYPKHVHCGMVNSFVIRIEIFFILLLNHILLIWFLLESKQIV